MIDDRLNNVDVHITIFCSSDYLCSTCSMYATIIVFVCHCIERPTPSKELQSTISQVQLGFAVFSNSNVHTNGVIAFYNTRIEHSKGSFHSLKDWICVFKKWNETVKWLIQLFPEMKWNPQVLHFMVQNKQIKPLKVSFSSVWTEIQLSKGWFLGFKLWVHFVLESKIEIKPSKGSF